ncbi:helix-hairpin-helix domain-containing protein [Anaerosacchariphilus polymeriproducens]|uniref:ComEA family DNA-binding protein n=1 Tax=Anaerosacchariphilus polymeriproducens TaxID=1812858 RepID=A0A371AWM2_9FIRM|nr:helix-hairpin-helix domain-containing protein [Anaerosacchariphilus polymeriproducens]RDU23986.1 ComEA family DNA-binding protein [Anaerosacchariphilus polymeriproducens]
MSDSKKFKVFSVILFLLLFFCMGCNKKENVLFEEEFQEIREKQNANTEQEIKDTKEDTEKTNDLKEDAKENQQDKNQKVCVYVCGAVNNPGVYCLEKGKRIADVIEMAGGLKEEADLDYINLAEILTDAQMIKVLTVEEAQNEKTKENTNADSELKQKEKSVVNLNTATLEQLMTIPGIGQNKADSIIAYREEHGSFHAVEDIMNIPGIKEGVLKKIKDYITVD